MTVHSNSNAATSTAYDCAYALLECRRKNALAWRWDLFLTMAVSPKTSPTRSRIRHWLISPAKYISARSETNPHLARRQQLVRRFANLQSLWSDVSVNPRCA